MSFRLFGSGVVIFLVTFATCAFVGISRRTRIFDMMVYGIMLAFASVVIVWCLH